MIAEDLSTLSGKGSSERKVPNVSEGGNSVSRDVVKRQFSWLNNSVFLVGSVSCLRQLAITPWRVRCVVLLHA
jgi:hypothetical protein